MANYVSLKDKKYAAKVEAFVGIRGNASAIIEARRTVSKLTVWEPWRREEQGDAKVLGITAKRVEDVVNCFNTTQIGNLDYLARPKFCVNYNVYGDLDRTPVLGENTNSIDISVHWTTGPVKVQLIPGLQRKVLLHDDIEHAAKVGHVAREALSKATGWSRQGLYNLTADEFNSLLYAIGTCVGGSSKLTRLVKGMLLYLDALDEGRLDLDLHTLRGISFTEGDIAREARRDNQAYIYNSAPGFQPHELVLTAMASAYPPQGRASHVTIPADANEIVMVARGTLTAGRIQLRLTAANILTSVNRYANDTDCANDLHAALMIAASLRQNRYFTHAKLPKVTSFMDLLGPCVRNTGKNQLRPQMSRELSISLGRLHQMISFAIAKDLATAAEMSASRRVPAEAHILEYMMRYAPTIRLMGAGLTGIPVVEGTEELDYITCTSPDELEDILGTSILEVLWLASRETRVCENGVFYELKKGCHDLTRSGGSMEVLREEMREAGTTATGFTLPQGRFFVEGVNLGNDGPYKRPARRRIKMPIDHAHECDTEMGRTVIRRRNGGVARRRPDSVTYQPPRQEPRTPEPFRPRRQPEPSPESSPGDSIYEEAAESKSESPPPSYRPPVDSRSSSLESKHESEAALFDIEEGSEDADQSGAAELDVTAKSQQPAPSVGEMVKTGLTRESSSVPASPQRITTSLSRRGTSLTHKRGQSWTEIITSATNQQVRETKYTRKDVSVLFDSFSAQQFAEAAGIRVGDSEARCVEAIMHLRGKEPMPREIFARYGEKLLQHDGYEDDSSEMFVIIVQGELIGAWWEGDDVLRKRLVDRGGKGIIYIPKGRKMRDLTASMGVGDDSREAMALGRNWEGDVLKLKRYDWRYVIYSKSMIQFMESQGVTEDMQGMGGSLHARLVVWLANNQDFPLHQIRSLLDWVRDTSMAFVHYADAPVPRYDHDFVEFDYSGRPSSAVPREYLPGDSKYILLACQSVGKKRWVSQEALTKLLKEFNVPKHIKGRLEDNKYRTK
ncbi:capsid protein [Verticillium dahliae chrysovirus 1]|uniref:Capsid protein n=1 Tax=Verticillium dahliae chrysovirus 1 TaxID=759389 RepID=D6QSQ4_9VIRU|nr:capsid protein [Verticillium dahliae chrysovirus 1]ADG21214.1 capsid protein [Verticillium dahliae chrysovirus 1]